MQTPMDLETMGIRLDGGQYSTIKMFAQDFALMCKNARRYNPPKSYYFQVRAAC